MSKTYRVIQWATGSVGHGSLRAIQIHPQLELAGVYVYSADKNGRDAGELCGEPATGITATNNVDEILRCDADCVMYAPRDPDIDEVCAILRSGKNVAATPFLFHRRSGYNDYAEQIDAACREGSSSLHGTGIHPGFLAMVLPVALSGMSRTIDHIRVEERADWSFYDSPRITFDNMRFGYDESEATLEANPFARFTADIFGQQVWMLAETLGADIDDVTLEHELALAPDARELRAGFLEAGKVSGQRFRWAGVKGDKTLIEIEVLWTVGGFYPDNWPKPRDGWTISIEGDPSFRNHFQAAATLGKRNVSIDDHVQAAGSLTTAMQPVNSIPAICEAAPGWLTSVDLGLVGAGIGFRHPSVWRPLEPDA